MKKSFSQIVVKAVSEEKREIEGIASTPTVDRVNDVVDPMGLTFQKEAPLLLGHDHAQPVGTVTFGTPTAKGLPFRARIAKVDEAGVVKQRTDEAWHSVKSGVIKSVSIGFRPIKSNQLTNGGTLYTKADVHELSLVAIPCNPDAVIAAFKSLNLSKGNNLNTANNQMENAIQFIRPAIAHGACITQPASVALYAKGRWGQESGVVKSLVNSVDATTLVNQRIYADAFVQAVFSDSILGKLRNVTQVPALARVPSESNPIVAPFVGVGQPIPAQQGELELTVVEHRKVAAITIVSEELLRLTDGVTERLLTGMVARSLARGMDAALMGSQMRDEASPQGLSSFATQAGSFDEGLQVFTGNLAGAAVIANPLTAVRQRTATEQGITAAGGVYSGFPVVTSIQVPIGKLFIVDPVRILAFIGGAEVEASAASAVSLNTGEAAPTPMYGSGSVALRGIQYVDWNFVPGAAVEVSLSA